MRSLLRHAASVAAAARAAEAERHWIRLGAVLLAVAYLWSYANDPGAPGNSVRSPVGWFGWFDQSRYLLSAQALASGDLHPARHWYPLGYPLLVALFAFVTHWTTGPGWGHVFLLPDLACLLAAYAGYVRFAGRCGVPAAAAVPLFLLGSVVMQPILSAWAQPWNTTLSAALIWWLLALTAISRSAPADTAHARRKARAGALGALAALIPVTRPADLLIVGCWASFVAVDSLLAARRGTGRGAAGPGWIALGFGTVLLPWALLYLRIYGPHPSPYMVQSRSLGFHLHGLGWKAYTLLIDPRPWYPDGAGMLERLPWMALGMAGMAALPALERGRARGNLLLLTLLVVPYVALFVSYGDLLPSGLWRYENVHYFKWTLPGFALLGFVAVRALWHGPRRRLVAGTCAAVMVPLSLRVLPVQAGNGTPAWLVQYPGPTPAFRAAYFGASAVRDAHGIRRNILQFRAIPDSEGVRLVALQDPFAGPVAFVADDPRGPGADGTPVRWGASVGLGWPCWLPPYPCDRRRPER